MTTSSPSRLADFNFNFTGGDGIQATRAWYLDVSPGDSTRYRLHVVEDVRGGWIVIWASMKATWWASAEVGGEVRLLAGPRKAKGVRRYDEAVVGAILDAHVRTAEA